MHIGVAANDHPALSAWRSVESQQAGATLALVGYDRAAQDLLETILDDAKPALPTGVRDDCAGLHYLLFSPFRYAQDSVRATRFGRPGTRGIFYGADVRETAMAETGYWRTRFNAASEGLRDQQVVVPRTLFQVELRGQAVDLRLAPYNHDPQRWLSPTDYGATWELGDAVRLDASLDMVRYDSVRDPLHRGCVAVFQPRAFARPHPLQTEDWILHAYLNHAVFTRQDQVVEFDFSQQEPA